MHGTGRSTYNTLNKPFGSLSVRLSNQTEKTITTECKTQQSSYNLLKLFFKAIKTIMLSENKLYIYIRFRFYVNESCQK